MLIHWIFEAIRSYYNSQLLMKPIACGADRHSRQKTFEILTIFMHSRANFLEPNFWWNFVGLIDEILHTFLWNNATFGSRSKLLEKIALNFPIYYSFYSLALAIILVMKIERCQTQNDLRSDSCDTFILDMILDWLQFNTLCIVLFFCSSFK